jgi:serine phosphatase RsbU (regulator of sigma subunit)
MLRRPRPFVSKPADGVVSRDSRLVACLRGAVREHASAAIDRIMTAIDAFAAGAPQFDDITLLVARRLT